MGKLRTRDGVELGSMDILRLFKDVWRFRNIACGSRHDLSMTESQSQVLAVAVFLSAQTSDVALCSLRGVVTRPPAQPCKLRFT